jgi:hypothetical protein
MGIFTRLFTPGAMPSVQADAENMTPQEPTDKEKNVPPPAPSGVRTNSSASTAAVSSGARGPGSAGGNGPGEKSGLPLPKPPPGQAAAQGSAPGAAKLPPPAGVPKAAPPASKPTVTKSEPKPEPASKTELISKPDLAAKQGPPSKPRRSSKPPKKSVRPPPQTVPEALDTTPGLTLLDDASSIASTFESLLGDLDEHFGAIVENEFQQARPGQDHTASDLNEVRALFAELSAHHMRSVRDFMIDVKWGEATQDWLPVCEPAVRSLHRAAERLEIADLSVALQNFGDALADANKPEAADGKTLTTETRDKLLASYDKLIELMPQAFALEMDRSQREAVILQSLLLQIPDVRKVTIDKLYAANLTSLDVMFIASVDEIVQTTGIEKWLAQRIVDRFQAYRHEMKAGGVDATRSGEHDKLTLLAGELKTQHAAFEDASAAWMGDAAARRKQMRQARHATLLQIKVLLARLGEVDRLQAIERLPFEQKITELEAYLESARDKYVPL